MLSHLGYSYAKLGRGNDALSIVAELERSAKGEHAYNYEIATIHSAMGNTDAAFAALRMAAADQERGMLWIKVDYMVDDLRADPRFREFLKQMRLD